MRKTLTISLTDGGYVISGDGFEETKVELETLILKGDDLFHNIYGKINPNEAEGIDVQIDENTVTDSKDKYIAKDIKKILVEINAKFFPAKAMDSTMSDADKND